MLKNKKIVIVGGSSGIGLSLAEKLIHLDAEVIIASRSTEKLAMAKNKLPGVKSAIQVDAADEGSVTDLFGQVGEFDHLISTIKPEHLVCEFSQSQISDTRAAFEAKFWGQYNLTRLCLDSLSKQGSITLTSGIASQKSYKGFSGTAAINGAVESFVKSVSTELAPIRINAVSPGFIERYTSDEERYASVQKLGANVPLKRLGSHQEVVSGFIYLLESSYSTGSTLVIDGGETCASGA